MPLPTPKGRRREVPYIPGPGNIVVLRTEGSGETSIAILRAACLANAFADPGRRVLHQGTRCSAYVGCQQSAGKEAGNAPRP